MCFSCDSQTTINASFVLIYCEGDKPLVNFNELFLKRLFIKVIVQVVDSTC